jgi:hypothetical protein
MNRAPLPAELALRGGHWLAGGDEDGCLPVELDPQSRWAANPPWSLAPAGPPTTTGTADPTGGGFGFNGERGLSGGLEEASRAAAAQEEADAHLSNGCYDSSLLFNGLYRPPPELAWDSSPGQVLLDQRTGFRGWEGSALAPGFQNEWGGE